MRLWRSCARRCKIISVRFCIVAVACRRDSARGYIATEEWCMPLGRISQRISDIVGQWEGVTVLPHRFGGVEFRVQQREIGHLHNDRTADLPFTVRERRDLVASGRARAHHMLANSGWVSLPIRSEHDIPAVLDLMRRNYERLRGQGPRMTPSSMGESIQLVEGRTIDELPA